MGPIALAAVLLGALSLTGGTASASPVKTAYSGSCTVQVSTQQPHSGETIAITGTASPPADMPNQVNTWTVTFNGAVQQFTGNNLSTSVVAPAVNQPQDFTLNVKCTDSAGAGATFTIHVHPAVEHGKKPGKHGLPNTGGPPWWWLLVALLAIASGTALVIRRRQEPDAAEHRH